MCWGEDEGDDKVGEHTQWKSRTGKQQCRPFFLASHAPKVRGNDMLKAASEGHGNQGTTIIMAKRCLGWRWMEMDGDGWRWRCNGSGNRTSSCFLSHFSFSLPL